MIVEVISSSTLRSTYVICINAYDMEPQQTEDLPRTPGRVPPNLYLDRYMDIIEFVEEEDQHGHTLSIKQRKKRKAMKRKRESGQRSEESEKEKWRKKRENGSRETDSIRLIEAEQAQAPTITTIECPPVQVIAITDTPKEETSTRLTTDDSTLRDQARPVAENRAPMV